MTKAEIIEYLYENNVRGDITIEQMADDLADRKTEPTISKMEQVDKDINVRSKDEPQTEYRIGYYTPTNAEILKAIEDEPQTDCPKTCPSIDICTKDDTDCVWK